MALLRAISGHETTANSSVTVGTFFMPTERYPGKEYRLEIAAKTGNGIVRIGEQSKIPAFPGGRPEQGVWTHASYSVPGGMLVKVFARRTGGHGSLIRTGSLILRSRAEAAYLRLDIELTRGQGCACIDATIEGRFDIVSVEDALLEGALIPPHFRVYFQPEFVNQLFTVRTLEPAIAAAPVKITQMVTNTEGVDVALTTTRKRRAMDI